MYNEFFSDMLFFLILDLFTSHLSRQHDEITE